MSDWMLTIPIAILSIGVSGLVFWIDRHITFAFFAAIGIWAIGAACTVWYVILWLIELGVLG